MRQSATCAAGLAASCPALRSGSPVLARSVLRASRKNHLTLSSVVRSVFHWALGKRKTVRSSSPPSRRLVTTPGQRLAHVRSKAVYAARATSALAA
jgi:hypothetical protein